ncbi:retrovirus-related pol polyprotein line-1 [Plakobranchus ocellatus]|uniref:Retrovirus-related pol polyprotein line-1 n=1 Tax=Plakobranchus ocellatus TaxID=259542 RepID=A0AAV3Y0Q3_9GAST|nr:retrovirus-related pol polyprotein line-1 [Plakobranchus ocellatus]
MLGVDEALDYPIAETRWSGKSTRDIGEGHKIFYCGERDKRNGVGIILSPEYKEQVVEVKRYSDRLIKVRLAVGEGLVNIISGYAPQIGETETKKDEFRRNLEDVIVTVPEEETLFVGADLNAHLGESCDGFGRIHGGEGYGNRNTEGERMLECLESLDMAVVNTFFKKRNEHLITYTSGGHKTQIDFILTRRKDLKRFADCKAIPGEEIIQQHKLVCAKIKMRMKKAKKDKKEEQLLETTEMRMLRRIRGVTLEDKMRSDDIRKELGVCPIGEKARESRLRWFGHVMRREPENHLKQMLTWKSQGEDQEADRKEDGVTE